MAKKPDPLKSMKKMRKIGKRPTGMGAIRFYMGLPFKKIGTFIRDFFTGRLSARAHWITEIILLVCVFFFFCWLNVKLNLAQSLGGPPSLRRYWLGVIVLLLYLVVRVGSYLARTLPKHIAKFPDIQISFSIAEEVTAESGPSLDETPIFLVLGATDELEATLRTSDFIGDRLEIVDPDLPVHWFGNSDAIWVTMPRVSAISEQLAFANAVESNTQKTPVAGSLRMPHAEMELARRRMQFAMRRLRSMRKSIVPVNGVVVLVPLKWMAEPRFHQLVDAVKVDMMAAQSELGVRCYCSILFHGLDESPEFTVYRELLPESGRQRRFGCTLPAFTEFAKTESGRLHEWLFRLIRQQVYGHFVGRNSAPAANAHLFRLMQDFAKWDEGFGRVVANAFADDIRERFYLSGVYFVELGKKGRVFLDGVIARMIEDHDNVIGWNDERLNRESRTRRILTATIAVTIGFVLFNSWMVLDLIKRAMQ